MTCRDLLEFIEPIAAGDMQLDQAMRAHIESCPQCAAELASARRIETMLAARPVNAAPARFTPAVLQRIRRNQWRTEQAVDRIFNLAIAVALVLVVGGGLAALNVGGVLSVMGSAWGVVAGVGTSVARTAVPSLNTYIAAAALLLSALAMWWWADRTFSL
jgi:anti-sigma factor RsiW